MNYYTIKSTEPSGYVLDKTKLIYPAHVIDLRIGLTYVLENGYDEAIVVGGAIPPKQIIAALYATIGQNGDGNFIQNGMTTFEMEDASFVPDFTHMCVALVDVDSVDLNSAEVLISTVPFSQWTKILLPSEAVEAATEET